MATKDESVLMTESSPKGDSLQFKPINEGLGFHPFSSGLPYSSTVKNVVKNTAKNPVSKPAAGAVAAGPPRFAKSIPSTRMAGSPSPEISPSALHAPIPKPPSHPQSIQPTATPVVTPHPVPMLSIPAELGFGYLTKRILAFCFDITFNLCLTAGATLTVLWFTGSDSSAPVTDDTWLMGVLFFLVLNWMMMTIEEVFFKTTPGKKLLKLRFEDASAGMLLLRAFAFPVSIFFFGFGIAWALFDSRKRCWHDLASKIQPVEISK